MDSEFNTMDESEETRFERGTIERYEKMTDFSVITVWPPPGYPLFSQLI